MLQSVDRLLRILYFINKIIVKFGLIAHSKAEETLHELNNTLIQERFRKAISYYDAKVI